MDKPPRSTVADVTEHLMSRYSPRVSTATVSHVVLEWQQRLGGPAARIDRIGSLADRTLSLMTPSVRGYTP
jgi:hypothetical protein